MNVRTFLTPLINALFCLIILNGCTSKKDQTAEKLGELSFAVTGKDAAQPWFKKGLLLLHSFEYEDAAENFAKAHEIDPDFAMAYWGEAMTYNHQLWRYQNKNKADSILALLAPTPAERVLKAKQPIEKDFITAINVLYGEGTKHERDQKYADYMGELHQKYPDHLEVTAFYSIALLGSVDVGRDTKVYEHAAEIAKEVLKKNPNHPGALHYLIHSYDDPAHAALALEAADAYAKVAPSAGHALHMPTHIYLALGLWDKETSSNEAAWAASLQRKARKGLDNDALGYHSFHWLLYGYMQQGKKEDARRLIDSMQKYCNQLPSKRAREHMILLKSTWLVESNEWQSPVCEITVESGDLNIALRAADNFVSGMHAYTAKDKTALSAVISKMKEERENAGGEVPDKSPHGCSVVSPNTANLLDLQYAQVMEMELSALEAWLAKDTTKTNGLMLQAITLENSVSYSYGPPTVVKPSNELYGEWLLETGQPEKAKEQFELALKAAPGRALSVNGLAKATSMMNENKALAEK